MATDAQTLLGSANCYACYANSPGELALIKLALLREILLASNPMADTSPQTLLDEAKCYACFAPSPNLMRLLELGLLAQISAGGGGGGGGGITCGSGAPVAPPTSACALYIDTNSGTLYLYYSGAWH